MKLATTDQAIQSCFDVMQVLRPHLKREAFLADVREMQREGYRLGYLRVDGKVVSVAGFRVCLNFAAKGRALYVYDLVTDESCRSRGYGEKLLEALEEIAREEGCTIVHLDSAVHRTRAHKFYMRQNYPIQAFHFIRYL